MTDISTVTPSVTLTGNPRIRVAGTYNLRSTAGYAAERGYLRHNRLLRSDALHQLQQDGTHILRSLGIATIIDLRDDTEIANAPSRVPSEMARTIHHPVLASAGVPTSGEAPSLPEIYRRIVTERVDALVGAVRLIADAPDGGVLVNCTAGKDRTGVVIAVTLSAVGVSRDQVIADYIRSQENLRGEWEDAMLATFRAPDGKIPDSVRDMVVASPPELMGETLDLIDELYGGSEQMLRRGGFDDDTFQRLAARLTT